MPSKDEMFLRTALTLAVSGMKKGAGGPFGCVIVQNGEKIGRGHNRVLETNDPTAHAEIVAIREACAALGAFELEGCTVFSTCEPCPMCLGAIYWSRPERLAYVATREDAAAIGFDDAYIYRELDHAPEQRSLPTEKLELPEVLDLMKEWIKTGKTY